MTPCAKFSTSISPNTSDRPEVTRKYSAPSVSPLNSTDASAAGFMLSPAAMSSAAMTTARIQFRRARTMAAIRLRRSQVLADGRLIVHELGHPAVLHAAPVVDD